MQAQESVGTESHHLIVDRLLYSDSLLALLEKSPFDT